MPRYRSSPMQRLNIAIPADLKAAFNQALTDPETGKPLYGGRSHLVCELIRQWLAELPSNLPNKRLQ